MHSGVLRDWFGKASLMASLILMFFFSDFVKTVINFNSQEELELCYSSLLKQQSITDKLMHSIYVGYQLTEMVISS